MTALCRCVGDIAVTLSTLEKLTAANSAELARLAGCFGLLPPVLRSLGETMAAILARLPPPPS